MKQTVKHILSVLVCVVLCLSMASLFASAMEMDEDELPGFIFGPTVQTPTGDVTGDGKVNIGDAGKLYAHVRGSVLLTDATALFQADITGDGNINMGDVAKIYAQVRATLPPIG